MTSPVSSLIHLYKNGEQLGPFTLEEINSKLSTGEVDVTDRAWTHGLARWVSLATVLSPTICPQCKGILVRVVDYPQRSTGIIVTVLGVLLAPFCVGIILIIYGWGLTNEFTSRWHCGNCGRTFPG